MYFRQDAVKSDSPDIESDFIRGTILWQLRSNMGKIAQAETATNR
jgi:hypothetical protein